MPGPGHWGSVARGSGDGADPGGFGTDDRAMDHAQMADGRAVARQ